MIRIGTPRAQIERALKRQRAELERRLAPALEGVPVATCHDLRALEERVTYLEKVVTVLLKEHAG